MDSNDTPVSIPPQEDLTEVRKPTSLLVAQFFLFPLIVIAFGVGIFVLFGSIAFDQKSPQEYLSLVRTETGSRRWQAAFDLANLIASRKDALRDSDFPRELLATYVAALDHYEDSAESGIAETAMSEEDWQVWQFLAVSLGELGSREAVEPLVGGLSYGTSETQLSTLVSLGKIGDPAAAPHVARMLSHPDAGVRTAAVYVLGVLQNPETLRSLQVALNDPAVDVRWNAAMALARMDDRSGADLLLELTDRSYLAQFPGVSEPGKEEIIVNAVACLGLLRLERAREQIVDLSTRDSSPRVRAAALAALESF